MGIRIVVADDHKIVRDGLRSLLEKQQGMEVVAEAENGRTTVQQAQKLSPDVVVMDISMHDLNGIEATRQIIARSPGVKVLALSIHSDKRFVAGMLSAGASGYLLKDSNFEELADAIRLIASKQTYLSPRIAGVVTEDYVHHLSAATETDSSAHSILSAREREVLQLLAEGKSTKQVALRLHVSVKTIETHRQKIMAKLDVYSLAELTKYAIREGLTTL
jgi:DNA-binding NarL/FixJ family response regulator